MRVLAWYAIFTLTCSCFCFAAGQLTVVSIEGGKAWQQSQDSSWKDLKVGQKVAIGSKIRTEKNAVVRLITSDTSMLRISNVNPQVIGVSGSDAGSSTKRGLAAVLEDFLSSRSRATVAATRSAPGQDPEAPYYQVEWESLMGTIEFRPESIPRFMDAAAYYEKQKRPDRAASLLRKLARDDSDNAAFASLADQALTSYGSPASLQVIIHRGGENVPSHPAEVLKPDEEIHVRYSSPFESTLEVYGYSVPKKGSASLVRLYPPAETASENIRPNSALDLPGPGLQYSMVLDFT